MSSDPDVFAVLEEMLDSVRIAEEVCRDCPRLGCGIICGPGDLRRSHAGPTPHHRVRRGWTRFHDHRRWCRRNQLSKLASDDWLSVAQT